MKNFKEFLEEKAVSIDYSGWKVADGDVITKIRKGTWRFSTERGGKGETVAFTDTNNNAVVKAQKWAVKNGFSELFLLGKK